MHMAVRCPSCSFENAAGKKFCIHCGRPLSAYCPSCRSENPPDASFCGDCGAALSGAAAISAPPAASQPARTGLSEPSEAPDGERRHLTVLFCDLVGSTELANRLDPEEWRELVRSYHRAAAQQIERYGGHVAQYLGDGVMAYFGWPEAHDDNAERAARAGLAIPRRDVQAQRTSAAPQALGENRHRFRFRGGERRDRQGGRRIR